MARELDTRVHYLRLTGLTGIALFAAMAGRIDDFSKRPGDTSDTRAWGVSRADFEYLRQQGIPNAF